MAALATPFSELEFLGLGLETCNYPRWWRYQEHANIERFKEHFGVTPKTCRDVWERLRRSVNPAIRLDAKAKPIHLLMAIIHLWAYDTEAPFSRLFGLTKKTAWKWKDIYVQKIALLFDDVVGCPCVVALLFCWRCLGLRSFSCSVSS